jgi:cytoskeletal protein RodZ
MHASAVAILVIVIVAVVALAVWLIAVHRADRNPGGESHGNQLMGPVQGGSHVGGGRSVAPRRDEEVIPDQTPHGDTVSPRLDPPEPQHAPPGSASSGDQ